MLESDQLTLARLTYYCEVFHKAVTFQVGGRQIQVSGVRGIVGVWELGRTDPRRPFRRKIERHGLKEVAQLLKGAWMFNVSGEGHPIRRYELMRDVQDFFPKTEG